jgi:hypothetical protein
VSNHHVHFLHVHCLQMHTLQFIYVWLMQRRKCVA